MLFAGGLEEVHLWDVDCDCFLVSSSPAVQGISFLICLRLLPVASFITPATLTVHMKGMLKSQMQLVPRVDFTSMNFAFISAIDGISPSYNYEGPRNGVQKTVTLALTDGAIQPISPPQANATWELNFHGPALTCQAVNASFHQQVVDNIYESMQTWDPACGISYAYISWTPDSSMANGSLPFSNVTGNYTLRSSTVGPEGDNFYASDGYPYPTSFPPLSIYFAALPNMETGFLNSGCNQGNAALANATIVECSLYNATYLSNFTYANGVQTIDTKLPLQHINDVGYIGGAVGAYPLGLAYENGTSIIPVTPQDYNNTLVEMFAYQSVMDSFGKMMVGTVANTLGVELGLVSSLVATNTSIMTTTFLQSNELAFLQSANEGNELSETNANWPGDSITISQSGTIALTDALEEAFRNITLSLIAEHTLQPNMSSPYAPGMVNVTVTNYTDVYSYSKEILWTAYGLGIFLTLLCVINGIIAFIANGRRTFDTKFSTILRTTRDVPLIDRTDEKMEYVQIHDEDRDGKSPLPPYLKRAEISVSQNDYASIRHDVMDEIELNVKGAHHDVTSYDGGPSSRM